MASRCKYPLQEMETCSSNLYGDIDSHIGFTLYCSDIQLAMAPSQLKIKLFRWTRNQKLHLFIDIYHIPYATKHRYWTGLLLLIQVIIYLASSFTLSIDPRISLLFIVIAMCCLLAYKSLLTFPVYKHRLLNVMESFVYLNIAIFAIISWCTLDEPRNIKFYKETVQKVIAYISVGMIFILLFLVIVYHIFRYASAKVYAMCLN